MFMYRPPCGRSSNMKIIRIPDSLARIPSNEVFVSHRDMILSPRLHHNLGQSPQICHIKREKRNSPLTLYARGL